MKYESNLSAGDASQLLELNAFVDDRIEHMLRDRLSLERALEALLPELARRTGAKQAFIHSFDESLTLKIFKTADHPSFAAYIAKNTAEPTLAGVFEDSSTTLVARGLDVAGEWFGSAGLLFEPRLLAFEAEQKGRELEVICEQLDNYLYGIRSAREKHRVLLALGQAMEHAVLGEGLKYAAVLLDQTIGTDKLLIVMRADPNDWSTVQVLLYERGKLAFSSYEARDAAVQQDARDYLESGSTKVLDRFGFHQAREEVLLHGVKNATLLGKLMVSSSSGSEFCTYDRDLLTGFAAFICQRIFDFSREYRTLARSFNHDDRERLMATPDYRERYLKPREAQVAMLFVDIAGFTRISEQVLVEPVKIAALVDKWGQRAVEFIWRNHGVFDKMVGDCVIGLFGPPFYEGDEAARIAQAIDTGLAIREMTTALGKEMGLELAITGGIHFGPLLVGTFEPNDNFTGFSSAMNNTARLQGQGERNEVLVMHDTLARLSPSTFQFGEERHAKVKNVENPLVFRPCLGR